MKCVYSTTALQLFTAGQEYLRLVEVTSQLLSVRERVCNTLLCICSDMGWGQNDRSVTFLWHFDKQKRGIETWPSATEDSYFVFKMVNSVVLLKFTGLHRNFLISL